MNLAPIILPKQMPLLHGIHEQIPQRLLHVPHIPISGFQWRFIRSDWTKQYRSTSVGLQHWERGDKGMTKIIRESGREAINTLEVGGPSRTLVKRASTLAASLSSPSLSPNGCKVREGWCRACKSASREACISPTLARESALWLRVVRLSHAHSMYSFVADASRSDSNATSPPIPSPDAGALEAMLLLPLAA